MIPRRSAVFSAVALFGVLPAGLFAQSALERMPAVRREIIAGNAERALRMLDTIASAVPNHPNVPYLRAHALGRAGKMSEATEAIQSLVRLDARYAQAALRDSTVISLRTTFPTVDSLAALASRPVSRATVWTSIAERDLIAEGTAYDPGTKSVLIGSLNKHKIIAIAADGSVKDRVAAGTAGIRSIAGIHVDATRNNLWAASNARYDTPTDSTRSALYAFDARSGAFRKRLALPDSSRPHFLNDIATGTDGTVYVTDTQDGRVWRALPGENVLQHFAAIGSLISPNGITISTDGRILFVADVDHVRGLELSNGQSWRIAVPDTFGVTGIDGLAFVNGALIAHHPLSFWRIAPYSLDATGRRITSRELIEANTPDSRTSTTGEVVGTDYVFIGNSQIDRMNLKTIDAVTMEPIRIYRFPLGSRR